MDTTFGTLRPLPVRSIDGGVSVWTVDPAKAFRDE